MFLLFFSSWRTLLFSQGGVSLHPTLCVLAIQQHHVPGSELTMRFIRLKLLLKARQDMSWHMISTVSDVTLPPPSLSLTHIHHACRSALPPQMYRSIWQATNSLRSTGASSSTWQKVASVLSAPRWHMRTMHPYTLLASWPHTDDDVSFECQALISRVDFVLLLWHLVTCILKMSIEKWNAFLQIIKM